MYSFDRPCRFGRRTRAPSRTGISPAGLLHFQGFAAQRTLPPTVPGGVLQHSQSPELQRPRIRRQRGRRHLGVDRLQELKLRRGRVDSRCTVRSETDPVRFEALLLSNMLREGASMKRLLRAFSALLGHSAVITYEGRDHKRPVDVVYFPAFS